MLKRLFNITICLVMVLGSLSIVGEGQTVMAEVAYLDDIAGISAYTQVTPGTDFMTLAKSACDTSPELEIVELINELPAIQYFICSVNIEGYADVYAPHVFVHKDGWIMAYYLKDDSAAKMIDVIAQPLVDTLLPDLTYPTLLEQAVVTVSTEVGTSNPTVSLYDFRNPDATDMLLVAEDKVEDLGELGDNDNWFTIALPKIAVDSHYEISYAFYQNYYPSFTKDSTNFVIANADYIGPIPSGTIYGALDAVDFIIDESYKFEVDTFSLAEAGYGALLITYSGVIDPFITDSLDWVEEFILETPPTDLTDLFTFDFAPEDFIKLGPAESATEVPSTVTLSWEPSAGATSYEYCIYEIADSICDTEWISTGTITSVELTGLPYNATFNWQVRAVNSYETTEADGGIWWSFATITGSPAAFGKVSPADGTSDVATSPFLDWGDADGAEYYEYCVDTEFNNCTDYDEADWINTGLVSQVIETLDDSTNYTWQVRAINSAGTTYADNNGYWSFVTVASFEKVSPEDGTDEVSPKQSLEWGEMVGVTSYQYCVDTTDNDSCSRWVSSGTATTVTVKGLKYGTTYYWQVRGVTATGTTEADAGDWWMFITRPSKTPEKNPPVFSKVSPEDGVTEQVVSNLKLVWDVVIQATSYAYCIQDAEVTIEDPCTSWTKVYESEVIIPALAYNTTYYWQVRATVAGIVGYAEGGYWSFTTKEEPLVVEP